MKVDLGLWLSGDYTENYAEIQRGIDLLKNIQITSIMLL